MTLSEKEQQEIKTLVGRFERETGIEAVAAVVGRCDVYPEVPWKAYALGSALGALAVMLYPAPFSGWMIESTLALGAMVILGAGAVFAALSALVAPFGRVFLDRTRAEGEARQYALGMFLDRELFGTAARRAVLLLVSRYERVAVVLPDTGIARHVDPDDMDRVARAMRTALRDRGVTGAFEAGFAELQALVQTHGLSHEATPGNALDNGIVTERGA
ncbi:MAG TPA: hypothetical protein VED01_18875 [Burkholderiales bacterium]|nr:hypothetical protein [Burkholderiales bacterium]